MTGRLCSELDRAEGMVGCGALRCLNVSIKYKKQVDRYEKIVEGCFNEHPSTINY